MKITFDAKRAFHNSTGLGNYSRFVIRGMARHHPEHAYLLATPGRREQLSLSGLPEDAAVSLVTPPWPGSVPGAVWRSFSLPRVVQEAGADVFHGLTNEVPFGIGGSGARSVVTMHDLIFLRMPHLYPWVDRQVYRIKSAYACRNADAIITISEQSRDDLVALLAADPAKIHVVHQTCHELFQEPVAEEVLQRVRRTYDLPERYVFSIGRIEERKNLLTTLRAMGLLADRDEPACRDVHLLIVGADAPYKRVLEQFIRDHQVPRVRFLHDVPTDDLPAIYRQARALVFPSLYEGFGIPIVEALFCGTPVITSHSGCCREVAGNAGLLVDPTDAGAIAEWITRLVTDTEFACEVAEAGGRESRRFEESRLIGETMDVYLGG